MLRFVGQADFMDKEEFVEDFVVPVEAGEVPV